MIATWPHPTVVSAGAVVSSSTSRADRHGMLRTSRRGTVIFRACAVRPDLGTEGESCRTVAEVVQRGKRLVTVYALYGPQLFAPR